MVTRSLHISHHVAAASSFFLWLIYVTTATAFVNTTAGFDGYRVIRVSVRGDEELRVTVGSGLEELQSLLDKHEMDIDVWRPLDVRSGSADVMVAPEVMSRFYTELRENDMEVKVMIDNIQRLIHRESLERQQRNRMKRFPTRDSNIVGDYVRYDEIQYWASSLEQKHPDLVELESIGKTFEGRTMTVLKIGIPGDNKPGIWLDAGIHAREWIAPAVAIFIVDKLVNSNDFTSRRLLEKINWYILVVANPDGYEFCHTDYRLWRLNTRPIDGTNCIGVDLNRNWDFKWGEGNFNSDKCSIMYRGSAPASEPEVQNMAHYILSKKNELTAYLSLHSYSQMLFSRWDYTNTTYPTDHQELIRVADKMTEAINAVNNVTYQAGVASELLYSFSGGSADWARGVAGIKYPFLLELRDKGSYGFILPRDQIIPTGLEAWQGVLVLAEEIIKYDDMSKTSTIKDNMNVVAGMGENHSTTPMPIICIVYFNTVMILLTALT